MKRLSYSINDGQKLRVSRVVLKIQENVRCLKRFQWLFFQKPAFLHSDTFGSIFLTMLLFFEKSKRFFDYTFIIQKFKKTIFYLEKSSLSHFMSYIKRSQIYMNITTEKKRMNEWKNEWKEEKKEKKSSERMSDESVMSLKFMQHTLFLRLRFSLKHHSSFLFHLIFIQSNNRSIKKFTSICDFEWK